MQTKYTPIENLDKKTDVMEHINDDHVTELLTIVQAYGDVQKIDSVHLVDIFEEGCLVSVVGDDEKKEIFVPFLLKGDLEENILYLAYNAMVKQGENPTTGKKRYFEVLDTKMVTKNMIRLILKGMIPFPEKEPGYAYLFSLKTLEKMPNKKEKNTEKLSKLKQWIYRLFLWRVKRVSPQKRLELLLSFSKNMRYYTLREIHKSTEELTYSDIGYVDIFLHGETAGGLWAKSLKKGDIIHSTSETTERCDHLISGQTVLLADETSLPTVAALLENWDNPITPYIISVTRSKVDQDYLPDAIVPDLQKLFRISTENTAQTAIDILKSITEIDAAWGALENEDAKKIRKYLRDERQLSGKFNRVKAYWLKNKKTV